MIRLAISGPTCLTEFAKAAVNNNWSATSHRSGRSGETEDKYCVVFYSQPVRHLLRRGLFIGI